MDPMLWELLAEGSPDDTVEVLIKLAGPERALPASIDVVARLGAIASCRIRRGDIEAIRRSEAVESMKGAQNYPGRSALTLIAPNGASVLKNARLGQRKVRTVSGEAICRFYYRDKEPNTGWTWNACLPRFYPIHLPILESTWMNTA